MEEQENSVQETQETGEVTQEQIDSAPEYEGTKDSSYSQNQNEIKGPAKEPGKDAQPEPKYEFEHNGKKVTGTIQQLLKWAQMGYDRPQWQQNFNKQQNQWNLEKQQSEKKWAEYQEIEKFAKQNPQWWDHVSQSWKSRGQAPQAQTPGAQTPGQSAPSPEVEALKAKIAELEAPVKSFLDERTQEKNKAEDDKLDKEILSIREKYKDLDWDNPDENGKTLEYRVLEHAQALGLKQFAPAFRDLLHDQLLSRAEQQAKLNLANGVQKNSRLGILGKSPTPQTSKGLTPPDPNKIRKQTYDSYDEEILADLKARGISLTGRH